MGVTGAAIATVAGRGTGVVYQLYHLFFVRHEMLPIRLQRFLPDTTVIRSLLTIAGPATIQFIIQSASWIFLAAIVARYGSEASAGYQTAIRLVVFFILPAWGMSNAAATLVGQNLGANAPERAASSVKKIAAYNTIFMTAVMLFFLIGAAPLIRIFIQDTGSVAYGYAVSALRIISTGYILYGIGMVLMQAFNGAGDTKTPTWISFIGFWLIQVPLAWVLAGPGGYGAEGAFIAVPVAEAIVALMYFLMFRKGDWKKVKV
jgi:Na+-driven multidrug efflux pump